MRGFKFHPSLQGFFPDDRLAYPLYEVIAEHKLPAVFHTGQTAVGSGLRGGGGILLKYSNPMHLDEVAADFPDMQVIMAHPSVPWQDEALSIAGHKPNVWIDLSRLVAEVLPAAARAPGELDPARRRSCSAPTSRRSRPERWLRDFEALDIKPEVRPLILKENARRLLGL